MSKFLLSFLFVSFRGAFGTQIADLVKLDLAKYPNARCLDGTPGGFYIFQKGTMPQKWHVYTQGGGWCSMEAPGGQHSTVDNCFDRSSSFLGSTKNYAHKLPLGEAVDPAVGGYPAPKYISDDPNLNPLMYNWTKVQIIYCDGGSFSGRNETIATASGTDIHLKGNFVLEAVIDTLKTEFGLADATEVVVSGGSAGGLATYLHLDKWRGLLPETAFVVGLPDGGFFLDWDKSKPASSANTYAYEMRSNFWHFNASSGLNQDCVQTYRVAGGDMAECFFAEHMFSFIKTPFFMLQSVVDDWQIGNELGPGTTADVNTYRVAATSRLLKQVSRKNVGGFIDSCRHHCFLWDALVIDGTRMSDAFGLWYQEQLSAWQTGASISSRRFWWQARDYPCADCCGGDWQKLLTALERATYQMKIAPKTGDMSVVV